MLASLRALLNQSIDYAGMFPPCSLDLESALRNQAEYVRSPEAWMLGAFVLPVEQFDATRQLLSQFDPLHPSRVAAVGPKTANADVFLDAVDDAALFAAGNRRRKLGRTAALLARATVC